MAVQDEASKQIGALPFGNIIGGPLVAAIEAQAKAARTTVDYIQSVAFVPGPLPEGQTVRPLQYVEFRFKRTPPGQDSRGNPLPPEDAVLSVPLLTIVPIPYLRIDDMTIQFKANISAESSTQVTDASSSNTDVKGSISGSASWGPARVEASFSAGYSAKKDSTSAANSRYAVEYTMDIYIHAVNDDMPKGLQSVLNMLNESIKAKPLPPAKTT